MHSTLDLAEQIWSVFHKEPVGKDFTLPGVHFVKPIVVELSDKTLVVAVLEVVGHDSLCQNIRIPCFNHQHQRIRQVQADGSRKHKKHTAKRENGQIKLPHGGRPYENCKKKNVITDMDKQTTIDGTCRFRLHVIQSALAGLLTIV